MVVYRTGLDARLDPGRTQSPARTRPARHARDSEYRHGPRTPPASLRWPRRFRGGPPRAAGTPRVTGQRAPGSVARLPSTTCSTTMLTTHRAPRRDCFGKKHRHAARAGILGTQSSAGWLAALPVSGRPRPPDLRVPGL